MDERPRLSDAFRKLCEGDGPLWITWGGRRLLIAAVTDAWLEQGEGTAIVATRRGYRKVELTGRRRETSFAEPRIRADHVLSRVVADKRVRAVVLEEHPR